MRNVQMRSIIRHLHFHVIPRYEGDHFETEKYERLSLQKRKALAEKLRSAIQCEIQYT